MSYTKEYAKSADGWFRGAWYYKPWYVRKQNTLPEKASPAGMLGSQGMEWPKYPGGYKPSWEERSGVPGLYKPTGTGVGGFPAIKTGLMAGRNVWRGGKSMIMAMIVGTSVWSCLWMRHAHRYNAQIKDEDMFRKWSAASYLQANGDCKFYCESARLDMYCRDHMDHLPGVNRNFFNQEDIWLPPFYECGPVFNAKKVAHGNFLERSPVWSGFLTA